MAAASRLSKCALCDEKDTLSACGRCVTVAYCGAVHQRDDWSRHKEDCFHRTGPKFDEAVRSIVRTWREQMRSQPIGFIRFVDRNPGNCAATNLQVVSLEDALDHANEWKVDWDMDITSSEAAIVRDNELRPLVWRAFKLACQSK